MDFGQAIASMKSGKLVSRAGWNGKGMFIYLENNLGMHPDAVLHDITFEPTIVMFTAQAKYQRQVSTWLARKSG